MQEWVLLVVGDGCGEPTAQVMGEFSDERVRYIDLPVWFGEQSGPNSIGMALADTEYIALLNHDDVWLEDHLATALQELSDSRADLFVGRSAMALRCVSTADGERPFFSAVSLLLQRFKPGISDFEPCSAWVFRSSLVQRVGLWRSARVLMRTPLDDWVLRFWREGASLSSATDITVLQLRTYWNRTPGAAYDAPCPEYEFLDSWLGTTDAAGLREAIAADVARTEAEKRPMGRWERIRSNSVFQTKRLIARLCRHVYRWTGWDAYSQWLRWRGKKPGWRLAELVQARTGRALPPAPDFEAVLAEVRKQMARER